MTEDVSGHGTDCGCKDRPDDGSQSPTRLIAPIFAAFSLPTIVTFSSSKQPGEPWHDIVLSLLIAATGLFMASIQLSVGPLYDKYRQHLRKFRASLTLVGLVFVAASLFFAVRPQIDSLWLWLPLCILLIGGVYPFIWIFALGLGWFEPVPGWFKRTPDSAKRQRSWH